jgi:antitoxin component YwqK of YwqJK toxin-antitoxin module
MKKFNSTYRPAIVFVFFLLLIFCLASGKTEAKADLPWWPFKINRFDKEGRYHGRWKVYLGEGKDKVLIRNGRFSHGKEVGKWRYYYPSGSLYIYEEHKRWENTFQMKRYYENGNLKKEGQAIMINNGKAVEYFWYGEWKVYDEQGNYTHTEVYDNGNLIAKK